MASVEFTVNFKGVSDQLDDLQRKVDVLNQSYVQAKQAAVEAQEALNKFSRACRAIDVELVRKLADADKS